MKYIFRAFIIMLMVPHAHGKQISSKACEDVWTKGEIIHEFDELEVLGGNYRPRSYIRYMGQMYYGTITLEASKGDSETIWVSMNCWDSERIE